MIPQYWSLRVVALMTMAITRGTSAWDRDSVMASRKPVDTLASGIIPGRYIIEVEPGSALTSRGLDLRASPIIGEIQSLGYDASIAEDLTSASGGFQAVSIEVTNSDNVTLSQLKDVAGVVNAWPVYAVTLDVDFDTNNPAPKWNPHVVTRVEELHKRGIKGKGQRICVVDSGADTSHPVLAGRIAGGKNMLDDSTDIQDCNGHGTFVSSVIVGQSKDMVGVAPEAEVFMYKIFGCDSSTSNDIVLKGLLTADADDCDIVSLSLGADNGYSGSVMSRVASEVAQRRLVIVAAGNAGEQGTFYASSPASGRGVVAVASVNAKQILGWPATIQSSTGESLNIRYVSPDGQKLNESTTVPLFFDSGDSCNPKLYGSEDQAVVIKRGICFSSKASNYLSITGFGYFLIFDSYNQGVFYDSEVKDMLGPEIHLFALTEQSVGTWVAKQTSAGHNLTLHVEPDADADVSEADFPSGGQLSAFSSWGLTFENDFYPSVAAPGGVVYGAFPDNKHAIASGTSFSTPYVAGVAALFFSHVSKDAEDFFRRASSTAALLASYDASEKSIVSDIAPLAQQGAGLIDAVKIIDYKTLLVSEPHLSLNDTDNRISAHTIVLKNTGTSPVTYKISHVAASTAQSRDEYLYPMVYFPPLIDGVKGSIDTPDSITIAPGATSNVEVTVNSPKGLESNSGALWSGKIVFEGSNDEFIAVPYMGIEASTYDWTPLEGAPLPFRYDQTTGFLYPVNWQDKPYKLAESDSPEVYYALRYGTYEFSFDLVGEDWTAADFSYPLKAEASRRGWFGSLRTSPNVFGNYMNFPIEFPVRFSNVGFTRFQSFSNGTAVPSGKYRLLSRTLRVFGNPSNADDWQLFLSDVFKVQHGDDPIPGESTSTTVSSETSAASETSTASQAFTTSVTSSVPETTTSSATAATITAVPGFTTTLKATATPVGLADAVVGLSLARQGVSSQVIERSGDWMELHVQIKIPSPVDAGSIVSFALPPQIVDVAEQEYVADPGSNLVGRASFDEKTGLYSIQFTGWVEWHKDIVGDFYLYCRFSEDFQKEMQPGTYFVEMLTVGKSFRPSISLGAIDRSKVYESKREKIVEDQPVFYFGVEVPGRFGPWNSVTLAASQSSTDDGFLCTEASVLIGTEFDEQNQIIQSKDITAQAVKRCELKAFRATYSGDVQEDQVVAFNIPNIMGIEGSWTIAMEYSLEIKLKNGSTIGYGFRNLEYSRYSLSRPEAFFNGAVDRPVPVETSTFTTETVSFTTVSPILNTTTHGLTSTSNTPVSTPVTFTPTANQTISTETEELSSTASSTLPTDPQSTSETTAPVTESSSGFTSDGYGTSTTSIGNSSITTSSSDHSQTQSGSSVSTDSQSISETTQSVTGSSSWFTSDGYGTSTTSTGNSSVTTSSSDHSQTSSGSSESSETTQSVTWSSSTFTSDEHGTSTTSISSNSIATSSSEHTQTQSRYSTSGLTSRDATTSGSSYSSFSTLRSETSIESLVTPTTHAQRPPSYTLPGSVSTGSGYSVSTHTRSEIVVTSVCSDPSWPRPVTVTYTVPCATDHETAVTTVTSVCTRCAEHPVTITYTQPFKDTTHSNSDHFTKTSDLHSASQIHYEGPSVTIPDLQQPSPSINTRLRGSTASVVPLYSDEHSPTTVVGALTETRNQPTSTPDGSSDGDGAKIVEEGGQDKDVSKTQQDAVKSEQQAQFVTESTLSTSAPTVVVVEGASLKLTADCLNVALAAIFSTFFIAFSILI